LYFFFYQIITDHSKDAPHQTPSLQRSVFRHQACVERYLADHVAERALALSTARVELQGTSTRLHPPGTWTASAHFLEICTNCKECFHKLNGHKFDAKSKSLPELGTPWIKAGGLTLILLCRCFWFFDVEGDVASISSQDTALSTWMVRVNLIDTSRPLISRRTTDGECRFSGILTNCKKYFRKLNISILYAIWPTPDLDTFWLKFYSVTILVTLSPSLSILLKSFSCTRGSISYRRRRRTSVRVFSFVQLFWEKQPVWYWISCTV
jgi:hypothetical protein